MNAVIGLRVSAVKQQSLPKQQYNIASRSFFHPDLGEYHTYGVQIITPEHVEILHDISVCKKTVAHIVKLLNRYEVSPVHLYDVVMDMLP